MPINLIRGGSENEQFDLSSLPGAPDWELVRKFPGLTRCGSIRSAADRMGLSPNALRSKIDDLERTLGTVLVTRHVDGIRPTPEGAEILLATKRMEEAAFGLMRTESGGDVVLAGLSGEAGCLATAIEAFHRGHSVTYLADASASFGLNEVPAASVHETDVELIGLYGEVTTTREWISEQGANVFRQGV